ncbi:MAG: BACON domain-containing protein [Propionibacteriaceae bacterium]|jgi:hypothetical protein|nr:BACON domain-containing protein [Propionibacteriaceae bacterium]
MTRNLAWAKWLSYFTAAALVAGVCVVTAGGPAAAEPAADILTASPARQNGLSGWFGDASRVALGGQAETVAGRTCWRAGREAGDLHLYFAVDPARLPAHPYQADIDVTYFDETGGAFGLSHSTSANAQVESEDVAMTGTASWRQHRFTAPGLVFRRAVGGADFKLSNEGSRFGVSPASVCVAEVAVEFRAKPYLTLANPSLLLTAGQAVLDIETNADKVTWTLADAAGQAAGSGVAAVAGGQARVDLTALPLGYYDVTLTGVALGEPQRVATSLAVLAELPAAAIGAASPFGVGTRFGQANADDKWPLRALADARQLGFSHIRDEARWSEVEQVVGYYQTPARVAEYVSTARRLGLDVLFTAGYGHPQHTGGDEAAPVTPEGRAAYAAYAAGVASSLALPAVEVYNEFNSPQASYCNTAACYLELLQATAGRLAQAAPEAAVVGPATNPVAVDWIADLLDMGAMAYLDVLSTHPYLGGRAPEALMPIAVQLDTLVEAAAPGQGKQLWLTGFGWPAYTGEAGVSEADQAAYLVRANVLSGLYGVERAYWRDLLDDESGTSRDAVAGARHFGLLRQASDAVRGFAPKRAGAAQAVLARQTAGRLPSGQDALAPGAYSVRYDGAAPVRVVWSERPAWLQGQAVGSATLTDLYGVSRTVEPGWFQVPVNGQPVYLAGAVEAVSMTDQPQTAPVDDVLAWAGESPVVDDRAQGIVVGVQAACPSWSVVSEASWLSARPSRGSGDASVTVNVAANRSQAERTGRLRLTGCGLSDWFEVRQTGRAVVALDADSWSVGFRGGHLVLVAWANQPRLTFENLPVWLTAIPWHRIGSAAFETSMRIAFNPGPARSAQVTVRGGSTTVVFRVTQEGSTLDLSTSKWSPTAEGGASQVTVETNQEGGWAAVVDGAPPWLAVTPAAGVSGGRMTVTAQPNTGDARSALVLVTAGGLAKTVAVSQSGVKVSLERTSWKADVKGDSVNVKVTATPPWSVDAAALPSWLTVASTPGSDATGRLLLQAAPNTGPAREATLAVKTGSLTETLTVTQRAAAAVKLSLSDSRWSAPPEASSTTVKVSVNREQWRAQADQPWLRLSATSGGDGAVLAVAVDQNPAATARVGVVTVTADGVDKKLQVTQAAGPGVGVASWKGPILLPVTASTSQWQANLAAYGRLRVSESASWLTVSLTAAGDLELKARVNSGSVRFATVTVRAGSQTVATFAVGQEGRSGIDIRDSWLAPASGGDLSRDVRVRQSGLAAPEAWTAVSDRPWLRVPSGPVAAGARLMVVVDQNPTGARRTGTVTIKTASATAVLTVTQRA